MKTPNHDRRSVALSTIKRVNRFFQLQGVFLGFVVAVMLVLSGCASRVPEAVRSAPSPEVGLAQVREADTQRYVGTDVRWGGRIAVVENGPSETLIQVISQPLDRDGRPKVNGDGGGRFLAKFPGFLDPFIYARDRQLTIVGTVRGEVIRNIGEYAYTLPVVEVRSHYLWENTTRSRCDAADWWRCDCCLHPYYRYAWPYGPYHW